MLTLVGEVGFYLVGNVRLVEDCFLQDHFIGAPSEDLLLRALDYRLRLDEADPGDLGDRTECLPIGSVFGIERYLLDFRVVHKWIGMLRCGLPRTKAAVLFAAVPLFLILLFGFALDAGPHFNFLLLG